MEFSTYKVKVLRGTLDYVLEELRQKYPEVTIESTNSDEVVFSSHIKVIEEFRNLYAPTYIESEDGKVLNLSRRPWRKKYVAAGINPSLAYILCMIAKLDEDHILFDPFCGSSTIPITAIKYFGVKRVIASDISGRATDASKYNFESAGIEVGKYKLFKSDIKDIKLNKQNIDRIVTNLPFGIRVGDHNSNVTVYKGFEKKANLLLRRKGQIIVLTQEKNLLREVFNSWNVKSVIRVNEGGLLPEVFRITRKMS